MAHSINRPLNKVSYPSFKWDASGKYISFKIKKELVWTLIKTGSILAWLALCLVNQLFITEAITISFILLALLFFQSSSQAR